MAKFSRAMRMNNPRDYARVFRQAKRVSKGGLTYLSGQVNKKEDQPVASSAPAANTVEDLEDIPF